MKKKIHIIFGIIFMSFLIGFPFHLNAQVEIVAVTARGFGATKEAALDQAAYHAALKVVEKHFGGQRRFVDQREDIQEFVREHISSFVTDLSEAKIIKKFRRNNLTARITVNEADLVSAIKSQFPDLAP